MTIYIYIYVKLLNVFCCISRVRWTRTSRKPWSRFSSCAKCQVRPRRPADREKRERPVLLEQNPCHDWGEGELLPWTSPVSKLNSHGSGTRTSSDQHLVPLDKNKQTPNVLLFTFTHCSLPSPCSGVSDPVRAEWLTCLCIMYTTVLAKLCSTCSCCYMCGCRYVQSNETPL